MPLLPATCLLTCAESLTSTATCHVPAPRLTRHRLPLLPQYKETKQDPNPKSDGDPDTPSSGTSWSSDDTGFTRKTPKHS